jgi:hypothetical protein
VGLATDGSPIPITFGGRLTGRAAGLSLGALTVQTRSTEKPRVPAHHRAVLRIRRRSAPVPAGGYGWNEYQLRLNTDPSRKLAASVTGIVGGLWSGTQRTVNAAVTWQPSHRFRVSLGLGLAPADEIDHAWPKGPAKRRG